MVEIRTEMHLGLRARWPLFVSDFNQNWKKKLTLVKLPSITLCEDPISRCYMRTDRQGETNR
jgi:hypothetical protein